MFQLAISGGVAALPWPSSRGVPAVPTSRLDTSAMAPVLQCTQRRAGFAVLHLAPQAGDWKGLCALCSFQVLGNAVTPPSVSQGACVHLQRPLTAPHTPALGPISSTTLPMTSDAPVLTDWHISSSLISWKAFLP